ncbi:MAG: DASS family sodium-coupled anion symporter [Bacteroidetes bacterium]|nr:DASS family sodium-coupled anion symporter [Bacteroidota bacterium]
MRKSIINFILSFVIAIVITLLLKEPGFTDSQTYVIFLLFFSIGLWATEAIPAFAVSLFIIAYLVFALGNPHINSAPENIEQYAQTFSDHIIWLLLGGFFLAKAMAKTKLDQSLITTTLKIAGTNPRNILIALMAVTMLSSMLISNTATTSMVLAAVMPLILSLGKNSNVAKAIVLGIPVASTAGGMATIIGTPANAITAGVLRNAGIEIDFLGWIIYGLPLALVLTIICCIALIIKYLKNTDPVSINSLIEEKSDDIKTSLLYRRIVIVVIIITVGLWLTSSIHGLTAASVCAVPLVVFTLTGVLNGKDIQGMGWDTLFLVAGGLSLGLALENTGLLNHYAQMLSNLQLNSTFLLYLFGFMAMLLATVMTNSTTSTLMVPICMSILVAFKLEVALIVALSSSTALLLLASSPSNAIIYGTGFIQQKDLRLTGLLFGLIGQLITILWVTFN